MNREELMEIAKVLAKNQIGIDLKHLTNERIVDAVVVYFGDDNSRTEIVLNKETGGFIGATMGPEVKFKN